MELEILQDESVRDWIWWTIIPLAMITGGTITSIFASKYGLKKK